MAQPPQQGAQDGSGRKEDRLHLNIGLTDRTFNPQDGRAYPTTPSTFPQPVFPDQHGQQQVWGTQQGTTNAYVGGPPSYFVQNVNLQNQFQGQQGTSSPVAQSPYRPPGAGFNDGTNGLVHQFSNQNLGGAANAAAAPSYSRGVSPAPSRPRTAGAPVPQQMAGHLSPGVSGAALEELPPKNPDKYADNVFRRCKMSTEMVATFFKENVQRAKDRNTRAKELEETFKAPGLDEKAKALRRNKLRRGEANYLRFLRTKERPENFQLVKIIGKGAFGEVKLVTRKSDNKIYALKTLIKSEMVRYTTRHCFYFVDDLTSPQFKRDQLAHVRSERDILAESDSPWVVKLHTTFQDKTFLYMLMEFLPGGDLMTMLIKYEIFSEDITRFYMAELALAIEAVHKLGFIHRDIKPDNILLDRGGHIKLTDFGLSTGFHKEHDQSYYQQLIHGKAQKPSSRDNRNSVTLDQIHLTVSNRTQINTWRKSRRQLAYSTVGTPDYIAPEIFTGKGYDFGCDWWSVGTIMFECLIGWPPFCAEESTETYRKIVDWPRHLHFPREQKLATTAEDFVRR